MTAPNLIDLAVVAPGTCVWARGSDDPAADLRGGVVWEISEDLDEETGEVRRAFETVRPYRGQMRFESIAERDVGEIAPFNGSNVRNTIYALGAQLGRCRGLFTSDRARLVEAMHRLAHATS